MSDELIELMDTKKQCSKKHDKLCQVIISAKAKDAKEDQPDHTSFRNFERNATQSEETIKELETRIKEHSRRREELQGQVDRSMVNT